MERRSDVWRQQATQWERIGPPLRPSETDLEHHRRVLAGLVGHHAPPRGLVLGVTPELTGLGWPAGTELLAVDKSLDMIERVWPGFPSPGLGALHADWLELSLPDRSRDLVVSDGPFGVLRFPDQQRRLLEVVRRVLSGHGRFAFRVFCRPEAPEAPEAVFEEALAGRIGSFHAFKLRLLMAVQRDSAAGVCTGEVWDVFHARGPGAERLAAAADWAPAQIATIDAYRGQQTRYYFPTLGELRALWRAAELTEQSCTFPAYELGERCPLLVLSACAAP